jgi:16S rRNA processing protein RimM
VSFEEYIAVGRILKAYGNFGWIRVLVYSGILNRFESLKLIYMQGSGGMEGKILRSNKVQGGEVLLKIDDINDRESAKQLIGKEIFLPENEAVELPEDYHFIHDLIGMEVFDIENIFIGYLEEVLKMGGNDVYVVRHEGSEILIPAVSEFVKKVDVKKQKIFVRLWEEM